MSVFCEEYLQKIATSNGFILSGRRIDPTGCGVLFNILRNGEMLGSIKVWFCVGELTPKMLEISFLAEEGTELSKKEMFKDYYARGFKDSKTDYMRCIDKLFEDIIS
jgi:hypothetical protein